MIQALLDTNFIITCMKQKIDFFEEFYLMGIQPIIPEEVLKELRKLRKEGVLKLLEKNVFQTIELSGKNVDNAIVNYAEKNPEFIIATLDKGILNRIKNRKVVIRNKKKLEII